MVFFMLIYITSFAVSFKFKELFKFLIGLMLFKLNTSIFLMVFFMLIYITSFAVSFKFKELFKFLIGLILFKLKTSTFLMLLFMLMLYEYAFAVSMQVKQGIESSTDFIRILTLSES